MGSEKELFIRYDQYTGIQRGKIFLLKMKGHAWKNVPPFLFTIFSYNICLKKKIENFSTRGI
jgi:hypothetical protein